MTVNQLIALLDIYRRGMANGISSDVVYLINTGLVCKEGEQLECTIKGNNMVSTMKAIGALVSHA